MNNRFFDVKKEKQDRIINAALQVFARNGYRHASTDDIVRAASISKGLLFHYFGSKLELYIFLYDYSTKYMLLELSGEVKSTETDYFSLLRHAEKARVRVLKTYPYMRRFLDRVEEEDCEEALEAVEPSRRAYRERIRSMMAQADYHVFEPLADPVLAAKCVEYTLRGMTEEHSRRFDYTPEGLYREICVYLDMFDGIFGKGKKEGEESPDEERGGPEA